MSQLENQINSGQKRVIQCGHIGKKNNENIQQIPLIHPQGTEVRFKFKRGAKSLHI